MPTAKEYANAIRKSRGLVTAAAKRLGVSRQSVYLARKRHKSVAEAFEDARERMLDSSESKLFRKIVKDEELGAITFYLKTIGKTRGYVEKSELDANLRGDITINLLDLPNPDASNT